MAIKLDELTIEGWLNGISVRIFSHASPNDYSHLLNVFAGLRKIHLHVNTHYDTCRLDFAGLGRLLTHATMLQSLVLVGTAELRKSRLMLSRLFRDFTWPHLKHFGLQNFTFHTDAELIAFFDRHRATIKSVGLRTMFLHEKPLNDRNVLPCEAWKHFFSELRKRSIKFQKLEVFHIYDCCHWVRNDLDLNDPDLAARGYYGEKILEYLHDGGPNPLAADEVDLTVDTGTESSESEE